ncbi:SpoIIE family protein phosphatase [Kitasatospora sp. NPDC057015]|uniref:SpoIIE family protein phosphatase n=1 Tax=Kitasatospora sp. NPDC057015 TaxID=3346001 RepID=UPI0036435950
MTEQSNPDSAAASVLVVDDDDTSRYILASWLRRDGHRVSEAADGAQGLALLAAASGADRPELAVVDVNLPDMSGFQVCERIKADPLTAHLPVIHVSATAIEVRDRAQGLYRGADAYLTEPIAPTEFLATVTAALRYARARRRAEHLAERIAVLNRVTLDVYGAHDASSLAALTAAGAATLMSAPAAVLVLDADGREARAATAGPGAGPRAFGGAAAQLGTLPEAAALPQDAGTTTSLLTAAHWARLTSCEVFAGEGEVAVIMARTSPERPPAVLAVPARVLADGDDRDLSTQLARTCAVAVEARRGLREAQDRALALQRVLLPGQLPSVPGVQLTVRRVPVGSGAGAGIGGDFHEAIDTPAGLLLAVGDVVGNPPDAVVVMGALRHALRAYAIEGHGPQALLERLDAFLTRFHPGFTATGCLALVEPGRRAVRIADAGHLPPILCDPDGTARRLVARGTALGLGAAHGPAAVHPTPAGTTLLLLTGGSVADGSVADGSGDVPGERFGDAPDAPGREVASGPDGLEQLGDRLLERFGRGRPDGVALLAARLD